MFLDRSHSNEDELVWKTDDNRLNSLILIVIWIYVIGLRLIKCVTKKKKMNFVSIFKLNDRNNLGIVCKRQRANENARQRVVACVDRV